MWRGRTLACCVCARPLRERRSVPSDARMLVMWQRVTWWGDVAAVFGAFFLFTTPAPMNRRMSCVAQCTDLNACLITHCVYTLTASDGSTRDPIRTKVTKLITVYWKINA